MIKIPSRYILSTNVMVSLLIKLYNCVIPNLICFILLDNIIFSVSYNKYINYKRNNDFIFMSFLLEWWLYSEKIQTDGYIIIKIHFIYKIKKKSRCSRPTIIISADSQHLNCINEK